MDGPVRGTDVTVRGTRKKPLTSNGPLAFIVGVYTDLLRDGQNIGPRFA